MITKPPQWKIRPQYVAMAKRYEAERNTAKRIEMKHKFILWISTHHNQLTDAEIEYLQAEICPVEDIYY